MPLLMCLCVCVELVSAAKVEGGYPDSDDDDSGQGASRGRQCMAWSVCD